nr:hypothetical protein [Brevibacillus laterosporus]
MRGSNSFSRDFLIVSGRAACSCLVEDVVVVVSAAQTGVTDSMLTASKVASVV